MKKIILTIAALTAASASFASDIPAKLQQVQGLQEVNEVRLTNRAAKDDDSLKVRYVGEQDQSKQDNAYRRIGNYDQR